MKTTQPIRDKNQVNQLVNYYLHRGQIRNQLLIVASIFTALRISDLLRLTWNDVYSFDNKRVRRYITLTEKKTGKSKTIALNKNIITVLSAYAHTARQGKFLFANHRSGKAISRIQAYRIIRAAADALRLEERVSCHSLRKTFGYHAWKNGISPAVIMDIYNHSSLAVTRRYLGVTQDDKNEAYLGLSFA
jgi:integrase